MIILIKTIGLRAHVLVFLAKMLQSESPLLNHFSGLYTYGQPKVGDVEFTRAFYPEFTTKIFHHAYNNGCYYLIHFFSIIVTDVY